MPFVETRGAPNATSLATLLAVVLAAAVPTVLAYHQPPSATLFSQCLAVLFWGIAALTMAPRGVVRATWPVLASLGLLAGAWLVSWAFGMLPLTLALLPVGLLACTALMVTVGADAARQPGATTAFAALAWGLLLTGLLSSGVAFVQVFAPESADGNWIAKSSLPGRAIGNLRQPNHLCSLMLWALVAAVALHELKRLPRAALWALALVFVVVMELSASRTGAAGLALLLAWGLLDRRLSMGARQVLWALPLLFALAFGAMAWWGSLSQQTFGAGARLAAASGLSSAVGSPNARPNIWRNALALIEANPVAGVGAGEFNLAWSLTPFANRPTAFFDHTHNLPLQLAVELGLPLAALVMGLAGAALWLAARRAMALAGDAGRVARPALVLVAIMGLHSLVEYPLWYAYFLLPTGLAFGFLLGTPSPLQAAQLEAGRVKPPRPRLAGPAAAGLMGVAGLVAAMDYRIVAEIYAPTDGSGTLAERIGRGQFSPLFAHHADYAAATNAVPPASRALGLARATHSLLDTRLMMAWAQQLADTGHVDEARWLAQRLRDFRNPDAAEFFAPCDTADRRPFQCQPPVGPHDWRSVASLPPLLARSVAASAAAVDQPASGGENTEGAPGASATQ